MTSGPTMTAVTDRTDDAEVMAQTGGEPRRVRSWVRAEESRQRVVDTTIEVLRTEPFPSVTSRTIAERSGVSYSSIHRNFGSMYGLFEAVVRELSDRFAERLPETSSDLIIDDDIKLRTRLVAWMLGEGVDPATIASIPGNPTMRNMIRRQQRASDVGDETAQVHAELMLFLGEGFSIFSPLHSEITPERMAKGIELIEWFRAHLPEAERDLGWADDASPSMTRTDDGSLPAAGDDDPTSPASLPSSRWAATT